jgi:hypothetical protein
MKISGGPLKKKVLENWKRWARGDGSGLSIDGTSVYNCGI